jgi:DNA-binding CsgD family transcriptional regulator
VGRLGDRSQSRGPAEMASPGSGVELDGSSPGLVEPLREPLIETEMRVLHYLPTNLTAPEITSELHLSVHAVKTHIRHPVVAGARRPFSGPAP